MRRGLQHVYQGLACSSTLQTPEVFCSDDHDFVATMNRHVLRAFAAHATHQFAEACFGVLKRPMPWRRDGPLGGRLSGFDKSSHTDQNSTAFRATQLFPPQNLPRNVTVALRGSP